MPIEGNGKAMMRFFDQNLNAELHMIIQSNTEPNLFNPNKAENKPKEKWVHFS